MPAATILSRGGRPFRPSPARAVCADDPARGRLHPHVRGREADGARSLSEEDADPNSVFTRFFAKELLKPDQTLVQVAKKTQVSVANSRARRLEQTPAY